MGNEDVKDIQTQEPVAGTTGESQGETPKEEPKPLSAEDIAKIVAEQVAEKAKEIDRKWQSVNDKQVKAAELKAKDFKKRAELAEMKVQEIERLSAIKPEIKNLITLADTESQARAFRERENYDRLQQARENFYNQMIETVRDFDIDPADPRLDYANDIDVPAVRNKRLMSSISKIQKEERTKAVKPQTSQDAEVKAKKEEQKEELENERIDNTTPSSNIKNIPTDINKLRQWVSNLSDEEYDKYAPEIKRLRREGKFK